MKKQFIQPVISTAIMIFLFIAQATAQSEVDAPTDKTVDPFQIYQDGLKENNYLTPLIELKRDEAEYMKSMWSGLLPDLLGYLNSFVGRYDEAYVYLDEHFAKQRDPQPDIQNSPLENYEMHKAHESIVSLADDYQVVMINEEHDTPMHRAFTTRLLSDLYGKGFRYLAGETLGEDMEALNARGYPIQKTGFYSVDPVYGDMLRTALKLGFKLIPYEHKPKERCVPTAENPNFCQDERERGQAQNLYDNIFKNDPNAKVLVHVGRGHNQKLKQPDWAMMAWHFQNISGIEPLSINQMLSERSEPRFEKPEYRYVTKTREFNEPIVFKSKTGEWWNGHGFDLIVYHPRSQYEQGRPVWLKMEGRRKPVTIKKILVPKTNVNQLVQAFVEDESADAIPMDQVIITGPENVPVLMLPKGRFQIRAMDEAGKIAGQYKFTVK